MGRTVIACYRPKPGSAAALDALASTHFARLYAQGLVTRRMPILMKARDATLLEVFEWKSQRALDAAHDNPAVLAMWAEYAAVCDYVPVGQLAEAGELFSGFESAGIELVRPAFFKIFNHVQVDGRIATSGALSAEAVSEIAQQGYAAVINLLPDDNRHALAGEEALVKERGLAYHHIPVDFAAPSGDDYRAFLAAMDSLSAHEKVFVHCAVNMRVSAFIALYGRQRLGWSADRAAEHVAEVWAPDEVWRRFMAGQSFLPRQLA
jgi:uncharacterized protein (TIGR01244 family)